jgi:DNA invertase Pin-like site-specific DNA recombinase
MLGWQRRGTVFANADVGVKSERTGLGRQRQAIAAACSRRGWRLVKVGEDTGLSTKQLRRLAVREALRLLETGDGNGLVAATKGRLSRLLPELSGLIVTANKQSWALVALDCALETTPPAGEPVASLLAGFAPCQRQLHSQRIRQALAVKRAQGVRLGRPASMSPYAIERIKREHAAGKSLTQIANGLNTDQVPTAQGGRRWYPATIRHTLNRTR